MADQIPEERQWALILVAGGDEAYNYWDTLEETAEDCTKVDQVWDTFEKSFEQSTSFWHFRDIYLADYRQDKSETTADLDLHIKQIVRGCQWKKETEEERMIDLLYHATIYYEIHKFVQESEPATLTYELVIEKAKAHEHNVLEYKDHQASYGGANSAPSYNNPLLSAHALSKRRPSGRGNNGQCCGKCGKSHERGNCPAYGKTRTSVRVLIISKLFVIPRLQPRWHRALTEARSHTRRDMVPRGATAAKAKEVATINTRRRRPQRSRRSRKRLQ